jgi:hypothetical protein
MHLHDRCSAGKASLLSVSSQVDKDLDKDINTKTWIAFRVLLSRALFMHSRGIEVTSGGIKNVNDDRMRELSQNRINLSRIS